MAILPCFNARVLKLASGALEEANVRCALIAELSGIRHNLLMVWVRSPWFPLAFGITFFILWVLVRVAAGGLLASVLLTLTLPLLFESVVWFGAAKVGGVYYDLNDRLIHSDAYDPAATLVRYAVICGLLLSLLFAGQAEVLPNSFVGWLSVIVTSFLWLAFAIRSYAQQVSAFARREKATLTTAPDSEAKVISN